MNTSPAVPWKTFATLVFALAFNACVQAQTSVKILATDPTALEGTSSGSFTLIRKGDTNYDLAVYVDISGTAVNGTDYTSVSTPVTIPAGYLAVDVPIQPLIDNDTRGNKTVVLTLQPADAYTVAGRGYATVKIVDDIFDVPPPAVTLNNPADGSVFTSPATVTLSADVDSEVSIQRVGFYVDDKLIATVTNSPYTFVWSSSNNGKHNIFARAVDEFDKAGVSDTARITVSATPVVTLASLVGDVFFDSQLIPLQAEIGDPNETIQSVSFYVNKKLVGTVTTAPYIFLWSDDTDGNFNLTAIATDANTGKTSTSPKLQVTVLRFLGGGS